MQYAKKIIEEQATCSNEMEEAEVEIEGGGYSWWNVCGECHTAVDRKDKTCPVCHRELNWGPEIGSHGQKG